MILSPLMYFPLTLYIIFSNSEVFCSEIFYSSKTQLPITGNMLINRYQNNKINISETIVAFQVTHIPFFLYNNTKVTIEFIIQSGTFLRIKKCSVNNDDASRPRGGLSWESGLGDPHFSTAFC